MSKVLVFIFLLIGLFVCPLFNPTLAATCSSSDIKFDPSNVSEGSVTPTLRIPQTVINNLTSQGKNYLQLNFGYGIGGNEVEQHVLQLNSTSFIITIRHPNLKKVGGHGGDIKIGRSNTGPFDETLCTDVRYEVTSVNKACTIDPDRTQLPRTIPPGSSILVKFVGAANTKYQPFFNIENNGPKYVDYDSPYTTDSNGQGNVTITFRRSGGGAAENGDIYKLELKQLDSNGREVSGGSCSEYFTMSIGAPPQPPPNSNPITANPNARSVVPQCAPGTAGCTLAGGKPCPNGKGILTAIGCIDPEPTELIKVILRLATGVAGGIAFLLMIFGAFQMITSSGNPEALKAGQDRFSSAIIGLLFIIFSVLILKIIGVDILGLSKAFGI